MKSPTYTPEFRAALVTYRRRRSLRISENRRWLLETDVSTIDSTLQPIWTQFSPQLKKLG